MIVKVFLATTLCPTCARTAQVVLRRSEHEYQRLQGRTLDEECMVCKLARESVASQQYLINQWRTQWRQAGGDFADLPAEMQRPGDVPVVHQRKVLVLTEPGPGAFMRQDRPPNKVPWKPMAATL